MPNRSQRHLREFQGYDSSGDTDGPVVTPVPITNITFTPDPKNIAAPTPIPGDILATMAAVGGVAPVIFRLRGADVDLGYFRIVFGTNQLRAGPNFQTWANTDPVGAGGITTQVYVKANDSAGDTFEKPLTVNLNIL